MHKKKIPLAVCFWLRNVFWGGGAGWIGYIGGRTILPGLAKPTTWSSRTGPLKTGLTALDQVFKFLMRASLVFLVPCVKRIKKRENTSVLEETNYIPRFRYTDCISERQTFFRSSESANRPYLHSLIFIRPRST